MFLVPISLVKYVNLEHVTAVEIMEDSIRINLEDWTLAYTVEPKFRANFLRALNEFNEAPLTITTNPPLPKVKP